MDIDEAGYLSMSLIDYGALHHGGPLHLIETVNSQPVQAPLVPLLTSFVYAALGRPTFVGAFAIQILACVVLMWASYAIGSLLVGRWVGLVSAVAVASLPITIDYIHEYSFAVPAAAAFAVAVWAALRSDLMRRKGWAILWGAALGAMVVTRTMTIAFLPVFALLALLHVVGSSQRRRSLVGVLCGMIAALLVGGPWYWAQGRSVMRYLASYGYGAQSGQYGASHALFSPAGWRATGLSDVDKYVWLPLSVVLACGSVAFVVLAVSRIRRSGLPRVRQITVSPWFYLLVSAIVGLLILQSSRNPGSAFPAPILPIMATLAIAALAKVLAGRSVLVRTVLAGVLLLCTPSLIAKSAFDTASGQPITSVVPGLGRLTIVDGRSQYQVNASGVNELQSSDPYGHAWRQANDQLLRSVDAVDAQGQRPVVFGFAHAFVNTNTLQWEQLMSAGISSAIYLLADVGTDAGRYAGQLEKLSTPSGAVIILCSDRVGMLPPAFDQGSIRAAVARSGARLSRTVGLPDGANIEVWVLLAAA